MARKARPVTDEDRQRVAELHAAGAGRNEIARKLHRSGETVSAIARDLGLSFDRQTSEAATAARKADAAAKRTVLMLDLLDDAARLRAQLWQPALVYSFGGRDNTYEQRTLPEPDAASKLKLVQAAGAAIDRSLRLDQHDRDTGDDGARSMLGALAAGLQVAYDRLNADDDEALGDQP